MWRERERCSIRYIGFPSGLGAFGVPVVSPSALDGSNRDRARSPVDGAGVARGLD